MDERESAALRVDSLKIFLAVEEEVATDLLLVDTW
jgi:hypothetical protein